MGIEGVYIRDAVPTALTWSTVGPVELSIDLQLPCWPTVYALENNLTSVVSNSYLPIYNC